MSSQLQLEVVRLIEIYSVCIYVTAKLIILYMNVHVYVFHCD